MSDGSNGVPSFLLAAGLVDADRTPLSHFPWLVRHLATKRR